MSEYEMAIMPILVTIALQKQNPDQRLCPRGAA
jgi:hypothetical protein